MLAIFSDAELSLNRALRAGIASIMMENSTISFPINVSFVVSEPESTTSTTEDTIAGSVIEVISCVSILVNVAMCVAMLKAPKVRGEFAYMCVSLACADCGELVVFALWVAPMTLA